MRESIDLTVSRARIKLCIRKNTHQYPLEANLGSRKLSTEDGQNQQLVQMQNSVSLESFENDLVLSTASPELYKKKTFENNYSNQYQETAQNHRIVNFQRSITKLSSDKLNNYYDEYNSFDKAVRFYLKRDQQNNSSVDYTSETEESLTSSDYDADDEDIEINTTNLTKGEKKCMMHFCEFFNKNVDINSEEKSLDLRKTTDFIFLDDLYNTTGRDLNISKKKFNKFLQKMCQAQHIETRREKRASNTSPQLALFIPLINEEVNESYNPSDRFKRCIRKSCHKSLCQSLGCYAIKNNYAAANPELSYETNHRDAATNKKMPFVQSFDSTYYNAASYPLENNSKETPIHYFKPTPKQKLGQYHNEDDISQSKLTKLLVHNTDRKYDESDKSQDRSSFYDDRISYDSSASLQARLAERARHLKKLLEENRERSRNAKQNQHRNTQQQTTYNFPHEKTIDSKLPFEDKHEIALVENNEDKSVLPNGYKQKQSHEFLNENQDNFNSKFESEQQSESSQTVSPESLKQEHGTINVQPVVEVEFNSKNSKTESSNQLSLLHPPNNAFQHSNFSSVESYYSATNLLSRQRHETETESSLHPENYNSITKDSSKFRNLHLTDNDKIELPIKLNNNSSVSKANSNSQYAITTPIQIERDSTTGENSDILQKVNLQEIYKNLPPNYEFSAGQWIRVQPSESKPIHSGKIKPIHNIEKQRAMKDFPEYNISHYSQLPNDSENNKDFLEYNNNSRYSQLHNEPENNVKTEVTNGSDTPEKLILPQMFTNKTNHFKTPTSQKADKDLSISRSQGNEALTELFTYTTKDIEGNIKTALYSAQDLAKQLSQTNYNSLYSTDQLTTPFSSIETIKANENIIDETTEFKIEQIPLSLKTMPSNTQQEKTFVSDLEKELQKNDELHSHEYRHNLQNHENNNEQTTNIPLLINENYFKKVNEATNNTSDEKDHFKNKGELTTSLQRTSNPEIEISHTNTYYVSPNESEEKRNRFHNVSNKIGKPETKLHNNIEKVDASVANVPSEHKTTKIDYSKEQSQLKSPHVLSNYDNLQFKTTGKNTGQEIYQMEDSKIPYPENRKFLSDSNLENKNIYETWNGTSHTVIDTLTKMLENSEQMFNIKNITPHHNSEWTFTSGTSNTVPSSTEETSTDIQHSGTEDVQLPYTQDKAIVDTDFKFRKPSPSQWHVEDGDSVFQNYHPIRNDTEMFAHDGNKESINELNTFVSQKIPISQHEKGNIFAHETYNLPHNLTLEEIPTKDNVSEQNEYSGTMLIVDPNTGTVTETIPVTGRLLTLNSEQDEVPPTGVPPQSHQPHALANLQTDSHKSYPSTFYRDKSSETNYPQEIQTDDLNFPPQFILETSDPIYRKNKWGEFDFPLHENNLNEKQTANILAKKKNIEAPPNSDPQSLNYSTQGNHIAEPQEKESRTEPFARGKTPELSRNTTYNNLQVKNSQVFSEIPSKVNITCLSNEAFPCETAKDDVYSNFFTIMLKEMHKLGGENCTQNCTNSKIFPACENCIKKLISERISDDSMSESVKKYAAHHCPQLEATNHEIDLTSAQSSTSPYTKCKYKFIADLTSLFGLWLRAITNSR